MPTYLYECSSCVIQWDVLVSIADRDSPQMCPDCGKPHTDRILEAPVVMRESHPDSYRRGGSYEEMKQVAKLKSARANLAPDKRAEINKEIANRTVAAGKTGTKEV